MLSEILHPNNVRSNLLAYSSAPYTTDHLSLSQYGYELLMIAIIITMYKHIKSSATTNRSITADKTAHDYVTKTDCGDASLTMIINRGNFGEVNAEYNYIYFVIEGSLHLRFRDKEIEILENDACFVTVGEKYNFSGDCKVLVFNQPAFGV